MTEPQGMGTAERSDAEHLIALENQLCFALYSAAHAMTGAYRPLLSTLGLTYTQYIVLLVLWGTDKLSVGEIGSRLRLDSGTLTPLLKRLEGAGLIKRERRLQDDRVVEIHLTEEGQKLRGRARAVQAGMICQLGMSDSEIARLRGDLVSLVEQLNTTDRR